VYKVQMLYKADVASFVKNKPILTSSHAARSILSSLSLDWVEPIINVTILLKLCELNQMLTPTGQRHFNDNALHGRHIVMRATTMAAGATYQQHW